MKRGIDQITAWLIATALAGTTYGAGYAVARFMAKAHNSHGSPPESAAEHGKAGNASGHGDTQHGEGSAGSSHHAGGQHSSGHEAGHGSRQAHEQPGPDQNHGAEPAHGGVHSDRKSEKGLPSDGHATGEDREHAAPAGTKHAKDAASEEHSNKPDAKGQDHEAPRDKAKNQKDEGASHRQEREGRSITDGAAPVSWDYRGSSGPEYWGELSSSYRLCRSGKRQSPIDIDKTLPTSKLLPIRWHYESGAFEVSFGGHLLRMIAVDPGNGIDVEGERFQFLHLEVHAPSEHKISGLPYDLELSLVHKDASGNLAIVNVLVEEGVQNAGLEGLVGLLPMPGDRADLRNFSLASLLPKQRTYYRYDGSLTTPPCSEGVIQLVMTRSIEASPRQIDALVGLLGFNARPVQALRGRKLLKSAR